jgi:flagellar hook-basal body complex protein FliE
MALPISAVGTAAPVTVPAATGTAAPASAPGFAESLSRLVGSVEASSADANQAVGKMLDGSGDVHDAMIALQRAELSLQLTVQVRNKLVQAYQDIMRMPV